MARNGKAYDNKIVANEQKVENTEVLPRNLSTEDELLEEFAKLIIDIYFDQEYEKEKQQQRPASST
jgi:hypothetical protein